MSDIKKPSQTGHGFDSEFDAFLREEDLRVAALYHKLPHPEPDAALDARVRAQARRVLDEDVQMAPAGRSRARRWFPAFGAAATLVLAAGLTWRLMPPAAPKREAASVADMAAPAITQQAERAAPVPAPAAPAQAAAPQTSVDAATQYQRKLDRAMAAKPESSTAADKARAEAKPAANGALAAVPKPAAPAFTTPPASAEPDAFPQRKAEQPRAKSAPLPVAAAAPPPPPAAMKVETAPPAPTAAAAPSQALREAASADRAATTEAFADHATVGGSAFTVTPDPSVSARYRWETAAGTRAGIYPPDPPPLAAWVEIVRAMLRDGHLDAARQALADLRAHHPDFRVPPDLRGLE